MSRIAELEVQVKELAKVVSGLTNSKDVLKEQSLKQAADIKELRIILLELTNTNPPVWSKEALQAFACTPSVLNGKPVIDTPGSATYAEARFITILHRLGLASQQKRGQVKYGQSKLNGCTGVRFGDRRSYYGFGSKRNRRCG